MNRLGSVTKGPGSYKSTRKPNVLEGSTTEGNSPVGEDVVDSLVGFPSTTGHEESCGNPGGPSPKAKYSPATDSELVP